MGVIMSLVNNVKSKFYSVIPAKAGIQVYSRDFIKEGAEIETVARKDLDFSALAGMTEREGG